MSGLCDDSYVICCDSTKDKTINAIFCSKLKLVGSSEFAISTKIVLTSLEKCLFSLNFLRCKWENTDYHLTSVYVFL